MTTRVVYIVDDDAAVRDGLCLLLESAGYSPMPFESSEAFLAAYRPHQASCLVLDVEMAGMSGLELQAELAQRDGSPPIIFLTAHSDLTTSMRALRARAADFLIKPVSATELLKRIGVVIESGEQGCRT